MRYRYAMSSVHRQKGKKNWFCAFYGPDGKRCFRSTGATDKRQAQIICDAWQRLARLAGQDRLSVERARREIEQTVLNVMESAPDGVDRTILKKILADATAMMDAPDLTPKRLHSLIGATVGDILVKSGRTMPGSNVREHFESWLEDRRDGPSKTYGGYRTVVRNFMDFLAGKAGDNLIHLEVDDIEAYKNSLRDRVTPRTVNFHLKVIKAALNDAVRKRKISVSPAVAVSVAGLKAQQIRRPFSLVELRKLLDVATDEWRTMVYVGLYTGLRLRDCANLTWANIDLHKAELTVQTAKTGRVVIIPLAPPLLRHLESLPAGDNPKQPICSSLAGKTSGRLSNQFYEVMEACGLVPTRDYDPAGKGGKSQRRMVNELSFHCLRHTATSLLKNAGVSEAVAWDLIGHDSVAVSRNYTHISNEAKRAAVDRLPDVSNLKGHAHE